MSWVAVAVAGAGVVGAVVGSNSADKAADAQTSASQAGIAQQNQQFDAVQKLLAPYNAAGTKAIGAQGDLAGLNGPQAYQAAIDQIKAGPGYTSALQAGNDNILANASATGGLRGGNVQGALAQFAPALLNQQINDQYSKLGGLTSIGQNAAAGVGNAGMATGNNITTLLGQQGSAAAGDALAQGRAVQGGLNGIASGIGTYYGMQKPATTVNTSPSNAQLESDYGFSDVRLKTNIKRVGTTRKGNGVYTWDWKTGGSGRGVLAQEVARNTPEAVGVDPSGILMVDYAAEL